MTTLEMKKDPCLNVWKKYQKCLTYKYANSCLDELDKFYKCRSVLNSKLS